MTAIYCVTASNGAAVYVPTLSAARALRSRLEREAEGRGLAAGPLPLTIERLELAERVGPEVLACRLLRREGWCSRRVRVS